jgi:hypothetical protein
MYISHKSNVLQTVHETEWQCRRLVKGLDKSEYWTWLDSVTSGDPPVADYSGETEYVIVECTDEDVQTRLNQLGDYSSMEGVHNIKWSDSKVNCEEVLDMDGKSQSPKVYVKSHFKGNNTTKDARLLADKWVAVRRDRDNRLSQTDYLALSDNTVSGDMQLYRQKLRDVPADNADPDNITWPVKP